jgi:hypothetical protein
MRPSTASRLRHPSEASKKHFPRAIPRTLRTMNKLPPFFVIGSVGLVITALLHIFMALGLGLDNVHGGFLPLYLLFIALLSMGTGKLQLIPVKSK